MALRDDLILAFLCYSNLRRETGGFELALAITLVLQANQLTKCASHPNLSLSILKKLVFERYHLQIAVWR